VLADGHIPWACEAFSRLHGQDLVQAPALVWYALPLWPLNSEGGIEENVFNYICPVSLGFIIYLQTIQLFS